MGIAPFVGEGVADVVATDESNVGINNEDLAMVLACVPQIQSQETGTNRGEATNPQVWNIGEEIEAWILIENSKTVIHAVDVDSASGCCDECVFKTLAPFICAPDE